MPRRFRRGRRPRVRRGGGALMVAPRGYVGMRNIHARRGRGGRGKGRFAKKVERAMFDKNKIKSNIQVTLGYRVTSTLNQQTYAVIMLENSGQDLSRIHAQINAEIATKNCSKFYVDACKCSMMFKNQSQTNVFCELYTFVPRFDVVAQSPLTVLQQGFSDAGNAGQETLSFTTPYQCQKFCQAYKILGVRTCVLAPGATELIEMRDHRQKRIEYERVLTSTGAVPNGAQYKGITKIHMVCVRGEPINDATTKTSVGVSESAVDIVTNETYFYSYIPLDQSDVATYNTLGSVTNPSSVLIDTGAILAPPVDG